MGQQGKISCLLATYNAEKYIDATLFSIISQILNKINVYIYIEILIYDDASTDNTLAILHRREKKDPRIQVFSEPGKKRGPYGSLNFLLDKANGEYIAIQDHDDLRHPEKLVKQVNFLMQHPELLGCGTKTLMRYENDHKGFEYFLGPLTMQALHPSLMFRNDGTARYPENVYMNDALFQKKVLCKGKRRLIANLDETLTLHRIRAEAQNYSYSWFQCNKQNIQTIFYLHPLGYACFALAWEIMRKIMYPMLTRQSKWIDRIERLPFILMGKKVEKRGMKRLEECGFSL